MTTTPTPWDGSWQTGAAMAFLATLRGSRMQQCWHGDAVDGAMEEAHSNGLAPPLCAATPPQRVWTSAQGRVLIWADGSALALRRARSSLHAPANTWVAESWDEQQAARVLGDLWTPAPEAHPCDWTRPLSWLDRHGPWTPATWAPRLDWNARVAAAQAVRALLLAQADPASHYAWEYREISCIRHAPEGPIHPHTTGFPPMIHGPDAHTLTPDTADGRCALLVRALGVLFPGRLGWGATWHAHDGRAALDPAPFLDLPCLDTTQATHHHRLRHHAAIHAVAPGLLHSLLPSPKGSPL